MKPRADDSPDPDDDQDKPVSSRRDAEDFYFENGFLVFTEAYHRKRGYCCKSGCRHCPYGFRRAR